VLFLAVVLLVQSTSLAELADVTSPGDTVQGVPNDGDWPGNESPPLAIDNSTGTKYLHFKGDFGPGDPADGAGFRVTPSMPMSIVAGLTFRTANDAVERDPIAFALSGSNASINGPYTLIATGDIVDFNQAQPWPRFTKNVTPILFQNSVPYSHYELKFTAIRSPNSANSMQIAEVEFLGGPAGGFPPEVDLGDDQTITWKGEDNTIIQFYPGIYDDDPCNLSETDSNYLTFLWSSIGQSVADFMGTESEPNAIVLFPEPGVYQLQLQVWDELEMEGSDIVTITVVEPDCPLSDLTGDCKVDYSDLIVFSEQWLDSPGCVGNAAGCADLAGNDGVDSGDFALLAQSWLEDWTGSLWVNISPSDVVDAGAQWRLDGGDWQDGEQLVEDVSPGIHSVEFSIVSDWIRPPTKAAQIQKGQVVVVSGTYTEFPDSALLINEIMVINESSYSTRVEGKDVISDWIEIYNAGVAAIDLDGWYLTDEEGEPTKWGLPAVTIQPDSYFVVYASGIEGEDHPGNYPYQDDFGRYHTNFQMEGSGEYLALVNPNGEVAYEYREYMFDSNEYGYPPQIEDVSYGFYANQKQYFANPTPGSPNSDGYSGISGKPSFSHPSGTFTQPFYLSLSSMYEGSHIRYTLDGSKPTEASQVYTNAVLIGGTVEVQARVYEIGQTPGPVVSHTYVALATDLKDFSSNLPIVVVDTKGQSIVYGTYRRASAIFIESDVNGRADITDKADSAGRIGIKIRGRSTAGSPKPSYGFELWDEDDLDRDESILGMPAESDWILYSPYSFDRALIINAFVHELSNRIGRYSVRTRFVEMYINRGTGSVSANDYVGLYILMEKIKRGEDRVDVEGLEPWDSTYPKITGGYMLKIDRPDSGDSGFRTSRGNPTYGDGTLCYVDPKEDETTSTQSAWIRGYLNDFEDALYGENFTDPDVGYAAFIDVPSWIDHNLLNMLAMNVDALRLSNHMHMNRNGKLKMGPLWDFDRSLNSTDGRDNNPETWHGSGDGTDYLNYIWWDRLFDDIDFWQMYIDRWAELRREQFSTEQIDDLIDLMANEIYEAQVRNYSRWSGAGPRYGGFDGEIAALKNWLERRSKWVDSQFVMPPVLMPEQGYIQVGSTVTYGSDPRVFGPSEPQEFVTLVDETASKRVLVPAGPIVEAWKGAEPFDDTGWNTSQFVSDKAGGVGYDEGSDFGPYISYDVGNWMNRDQTANANPSCYIRIYFDVESEQLAQIASLKLRMRYDDAYIVYLNGEQVARTSNVPANPNWNSSSVGGAEYGAFQDTDISAHIDRLEAGANILAIQGFNSSTGSSDFLISAVLQGAIDSDPQSENQNAGDISVSAVEYTGTPIALSQTTRIKARVLANGTYSPWSGLTEATFAVDNVMSDLRITEIMFHPLGDPDPCSPINDDDFEFVELTNVGAGAIDLHWVSFTEGIHYNFPMMLILEPGAATVVVKNQAAFAARYDTSGIDIAPGVYEGYLSNGGERIRLEDAIGNTILDFEYKDGWRDVADDEGFSLTIINPVNADPNSWDEKDSWRASVYAGGSPGADDGGILPDPGAIVFNEILAHSHDEASDWVEMYNTTGGAIDIGGWYLSDSASNLKKYRIAPGTAIGAGQYKVFHETTHFGADSVDPGKLEAFALSENGETVYLSSAIAGDLAGYRESQNVGASATSVSFGRYFKGSTGNYNFVPMSFPTPWRANSYPKVGPVIISEISYNPSWPAGGSYTNDQYEYIEIKNTSGVAITLYRQDKSESWKITDGVDFTFPGAPSAATIAAGDYLIIARKPEAFMWRYPGVPAAKVLGPYVGSLSNAGERVQLSSPGDLDKWGVRQYIREDRVVYSDGSHPGSQPGGIDLWPTEADGEGYSLHRIDDSLYGNDPNNWQAQGPLPGE